MELRSPPQDPRGGHRRVLVTGAASGLGAALVRAFESAGDQVLATDIEAGPAITPLDITSDRDWERVRDEVLEAWGGLDVLVNNAGVAGGGRLEVATIEEWQWILDINLLGMVRGMRTFVPMLKQQRSGHIVNVASLAGLVHPAGMASYNAVKAAVVATTETAGHELAAWGIACSVVCPSYFRTPLMERARSSDSRLVEVLRGLVDGSPYDADDIAAEILTGIADGAELILPDAPARSSFHLKTTDRSAYDAQMRSQAAKLAGIATTSEGDGDE